MPRTAAGRSGLLDDFKLRAAARLVDRFSESE
jgi:hypothetical protein